MFDMSTEKGKWITYQGRHIFIEDGQTLEQAFAKHSKQIANEESDRRDREIKAQEQSQKAEAIEQDLSDFEKEILDREVASYTKEYRESKWFKQPTLRDALDDDLYTALQNTRKALEYEKTYSGGVDVNDWIDKLQENLDRYEGDNDYEAWFYKKLLGIVKKAHKR